MTAQEQVVRLLTARGITLSLAESCTGGLLSARITDVPGASAVFLGSAVTYWSQSKAALLGVDPTLLAREGAVCPQVAEQMAAGVRRLFGSDLGIGVTGLAGPSGDGSAARVGDVYIGFAAPEGVTVAELHEPLGRARVRALACDTALSLLLRWAEGSDGA